MAILPYELRNKIWHYKDQGYKNKQIVDLVEDDAEPYIESRKQLVRCVGSIVAKHTLGQQPLGKKYESQEEPSKHGETQWSGRSKKQWTFIQKKAKEEWDNTKIHSNGIEIPTNKGTLLVKKPQTILEVEGDTFLQAALLLDGNPLSISNTLNLGKYEGKAAIERLRKIVERINNS